MKLALINIRQLVTVASGGARAKTGRAMGELHVIENAAVMVEGDAIRWVGRMEELSMGSLGGETDILDCREQVVMPGFIDAHTHAVFAGNRAHEFARRASGATYQEIAAEGGGIMSTVSAVRETSKKDLKKQARRFLAGMLRHGTTTVEIKSGYGLSSPAEIKLVEAIAELRNEEVLTIIPTFLGAHALPPEFSADRAGYIAEITGNMIPYLASRKLAEFCDVFCEAGYFSVEESRTILREAQGRGFAAKLHGDELSPGGGAELAAELQATSVDHLEHVSEKGIRALAGGATVAVLLPGVSFFLNHPHAPARRLIDANVPVAIATDFNPGSCMSYSMPLMMTIACAQMRMSPEEAITSATLNAAAAVSRSHELGSIEPGKKADLLLLDIDDYRHLAYHFGENHVHKVVKNGVILELQ